MRLGVLTAVILLASGGTALSSARTTCNHGPCLGVLTAGTYTSHVFRPTLTYTVPAGGWTNYSDERGVYTLAPPRVSLNEENNAVNVVLLWRKVQAPEMNCATIAIPNARVPDTVPGIVKWLTHQKRLVTSQPLRVTIGGLKGYTLTVRIARGEDMRCGVPVLMENGMSGIGEFNLGNLLDHAKLYLLTRARNVPLGIIADSSGRHGPSLLSDSHVIKHFRFARS
jgi:hypothetical protein